MPDFLKRFFNREAPAPLTPVEALLKENHVKYKKQPDGAVVVRRDLDLNFKKYDALPDLSSVIIGGKFSCGYNDNLKSLAGAPRRVDGEFNCEGMPLSWVGPDKLTFGSLVTDHGAYASWEQIPEWLRLDDAGKRRLLDATPAEDKPQMNEHLKWALRTEDAPLVTICLDKGADANCDGGEPLLIAARRESMDLAAMLCIAGANTQIAIAKANEKIDEVTYYDAGRGNISDGAVFDLYDPPLNWLYHHDGALRERAQLHKIEQLQQANAGLQNRVAALQDEAKPVELDKPKMKPPGI
jgi:hypothetical protein